MKNGTYDMTFPIQRKPEREAFMVFTDVILEDRVFVWHLKTRKDGLCAWQTINDLRPYTIGIVSGYTYRDTMDNAIDNGVIKTEKVNSAEYNFKKLLCKRFDGFLESESVVMSFFSKESGIHKPYHPRPPDCIQGCVQNRNFKKITVCADAAGDQSGDPGNESGRHH